LGCQHSLKFGNTLFQRLDLFPTPLQDVLFESRIRPG